jgi:protein SCO1/2
MASETEQSVPATSAPPPRFAFKWRDGLLLLTLLVIVGAIAALLIHGPAKTNVLGESTSTTANGAYEGLTISPKAEPPLVLRNYLGNTVNIRSFRGKAVLVTFLYTHCPFACPLIATHLHTALLKMSPAERKEVQIIAVSVDPRGDTPATVAQFLHDHGMTGKMDYLLGNANQLAAVWSAWGVGAKREAGDPALVAHSALIYGITGDGKVLTVYQDTDYPAVIVHDVPRLRANVPGPAT